jgi:antitoxin component YwqK of YwqJK toxin-antitoxin module
MYKDNLKHGKGISVFPNGKINEGLFKDDKFIKII